MNRHISKTAVLGDGAWGTSLALVLLWNKHDVTLWGPFKENIDAINATGANQFLKGVKLPKELRAEADIAKAVADLLVLASPSQYMRKTLNALKPHFRKEQHRLVDIAKGIEIGSLKRMSEICEEILGESHYAALSGPSHAEEVSRKVPTAVVIASKEIELAVELQNLFMNEFFRVYTSDDLTGVELGGALKNVYAIATGMIDDARDCGNEPSRRHAGRQGADLFRLERSRRPDRDLHEPPQPQPLCRGGARQGTRDR